MRNKGQREGKCEVGHRRVAGDNFNTGKVRSRLINFINWEGAKGKRSEEDGTKIDRG